MKIRLRVLALLVWGGINMSSPVNAQNLSDLKGQPFFMVSKGILVSDLLHHFGANHQLSVVVSPKVTDRFIGTLRADKAENQLNELARTYQLRWYYNGREIYIYKAYEVSSEVMYLERDLIASLQAYLHRNRITDPKSCVVKQIESIDALDVFGVPICVSRVKALSASMRQAKEQQKQNASEREGVRVFPLRFASAVDTTYQYRSKNIIVPGVVSVLREMSGGESVRQDNASIEQQQRGNVNANSPQFSADPRQNAVVIRDREINMPMYISIINQLDIQQQGIEIAVAIIDVNANDLEQLGVDWSGRIKLGGGGVEFNSQLSRGGVLNSVIGNSNSFMMKVSALQQNSRAKILSQPSVITLNNVEAVLDKNITFYTKLEGDGIAQLASVTSGTLLQVTPRIIDGAMTPNATLQLTINIQDGDQQSAFSNKESLPQVQNSEIATQATLKAGQSLLLGGFVQDRETRVDRKLPLLGDIPLLGGLFRNTNTEKTSVVRLFLIKAVPVNLH